MNELAAKPLTIFISSGKPVLHPVSFPIALFYSSFPL